MKNLQVFKRATGLLELHADLPQFRGQMARKICYGQICQKIHHNNDLQHTNMRMRDRVRGNQAIELSSTIAPNKTNDSPAVRYAHERGSKIQATMMTSG